MRQRASVVTAMALLFAGTGCGAGPDRPGMTVFPDMMTSVPYDAYDANPVLPGGITLMLPPDGTVPLEGAPFPYGPEEVEAERAGRELVNPLAGDAADLARGQYVFESACSVCHGPGGEGDGPVIGRFPNPPSLLSERTRAFADGRIYHVISRGQGLMPSYAAQVLPADRWRLVLYIRSLQAATPAPVASPDQPGAAAAAPEQEAP